MIEEYWSRFSTTYDRNQEFVVGMELLDEIKRELGNLPDLGETLELASGTGYFTESIAGRSTSLLATDLSDNLLEVLRSRVGDRPDVSVQKENSLSTSFEPGTFDSVFVANLIHVVESPDEILSECHRILRHRGRLVVVTFTGSGLGAWDRIMMAVRFVRAWGRPPAHVHSFSPEDVGAMARKAGFEIDESKLLGGRTNAVFVVASKP